MSAEEIAIANLAIAKLQLWVTAIAIFIGPLTGVIFTFWLQSRKDKSSEKHKLFLTLMAERKAPLVSAQAAQALNKIDVVFSDSNKIKSLWHEYYALLHQPPGELRGHKWMELLSAMAAELNYADLSQLDLDKFYIPQGHVDDADFQKKVAQQWSRVLENTERFIVEQKSD